MHRSLLPLLMLLPLFFAGACGPKKTRVAKPPRIGQSEKGIASWYGHPYHGRRAANGEIYDMEQLTAAHRTLPFGTWVRVRNLSNDLNVDVRIQDRGPFIKDRIIDLSRAAAREIDLIRPGIAEVRVTVIETPRHPPIASKPPVEAPPSLPSPPPASQPVEVAGGLELYGVQIGAFQDRARAEHLRARMKESVGAAQIVERAGAVAVYRVIVGETSEPEGADELRRRLETEFPDSFVVRVDQPSPAQDR